MIHLAHKKVVLVIVEGPSDDVALGVMLNQIFDKDAVHIHIMHGDITTQNGVTQNNIVSKVGNCVKQYAVQNHYKPADFKEIIHIVDTDAAYLPENRIVEEAESVELSYLDDGIHTRDKQKVISRNKQKTENLFRLRTCGNILGIPYRVYYMSCNLDHGLYDKRNSSDEEKEQDSYNFAKLYKKNVEDFLKFMCDSTFSVKGDFKESWKFIEKDMHSIERHTNLPICLEEEYAEKI